MSASVPPNRYANPAAPTTQARISSCGVLRGSVRAVFSPCFGLDDAQPAGGQLTGKLVHGLDAAQMDRHGGHVPHQRDGIPPRQVRRRKDAVGQNIDMEVPHAEAGGHDLHGLLRAEHLAAVFQQRLARVHDQLQRTVKQCISHGYSPAQR